MTEILLSIAAAFLFAFYDYVGYNTFSVKNLVLFRVTQVIFQIGLTVALGSYSIMSALGFLVLWWTWCCDILYYVFYDVFKWYGSPYAGSAFQNEVLENQVTWAWWTPYGLLRGKKNEPIAGKILIYQAVVGLVYVLITAG